MNYQCSICGQKVSGDSAVFNDHSEEHIVDIIKAKHPDWVEKDGVCHKCFDYYKKELKGNTDS